MSDGYRVWQPTEEVDTSDEGAHKNWPERFFEAIVDGFLGKTGNGGWLVGDAMTYMLDARALFEFAAPLMIATARGDITLASRSL